MMLGIVTLDRGEEKGIVVFDRHLPNSEACSNGGTRRVLAARGSEWA